MSNCHNRSGRSERTSSRKEAQKEIERNEICKWNFLAKNVTSISVHLYLH